ncbi:hypothetical protein RhiirC2_781672 [Rhizophagus irregularis]|uniref:Uncharacterized protein n=1 Tax=Rhizophagus irregularis TaxID=588596 RepID=A0A2N1N4R8_9GLOM|nr:hypothetical protein RhiirC2_781672 [Rhizophagus irregularis]
MPVHKHQQEITNRRIKRRITNRICARRQTPTNSANMFLTLAAQLPLQITNTPFANQLFNGKVIRITQPIACRHIQYKIKYFNNI